MKQHRFLLIAASLILVFEFGARLFFPAQETESSGLSLLRILFDCAMIVGLIGISIRNLKSASVGPWIVLPALGVLAGLGLLILRLNGGPPAELPPRPSQSASAPSVYPPDLEELGKRAWVVMASYQAAESAALETRWVKADAQRQLPREALKEFITSQRKLIDATDRLIELQTEPGFEANFARAIKLAEAHGEHFPKVDLSPDGWRLLRRIYVVSCQFHVLLDSNWDDWVAHPFPEKEKASPWQKEALVLLDEIRIADQEHDAYLEKHNLSAVSAAPSPPAPTLSETARPRELSVEESTLIREAFDAGERHDYDQAITKYSELLRRYPALKEAYHNRGLAYQAKGDYSKAIADYNEAIRLDPRYAVAYHNRGNAYSLQGDGRAMADYDRAIELDPTANAYGDRANAHREKRDYVKSLSDSNDSIRLNPRSAQAYFGRGFTYQATGEYDKALADYSRALELDSNIAGVYHNRGYVYGTKRDYVRSLADYKEAIRLDAKFTPAYNGTAWLLATCPQSKYRDGKKAVEYASKACELSDWKDSNYVDTLAAAYAEARDFPQAIKWAKQYLDSPNLTEEAVTEGKSRLELYRAGKPYHTKD